MSKSQRKAARTITRARRTRRSRTWLFLIAATVIAVVLSATYLMRPAGPAPSSATTAANSMTNGLTFLQTVANSSTPEGAAPAGMVWIPGGEFSMGAQDPLDAHDMVGMQATRDSRPIHRVYVDGFWMDKTEVTNAQFAAFVKAPIFAGGRT